MRRRSRLMTEIERFAVNSRMSAMGRKQTLATYRDAKSQWAERRGRASCRHRQGATCAHTVAANPSDADYCSPIFNGTIVRPRGDPNLIQSVVVIGRSHSYSSR